MKYNSFYVYDKSIKEFSEVKLNTMVMNSLEWKAYNEYIKIGVPARLKVDKVKIEGNPEIGGFVTVFLSSETILYKRIDNKKLSNYWESRFSKLDKIGDSWYVECKNH